MKMESLDKFPINSEWLANEADEALSYFGPLASYLEFHNQVQRDIKSGVRADLSSSLSDELILQTYDAEQNMRMLHSKALRIIKHLDSAGIIKSAFDHSVQRMKDGSEINATEEWKQALEVDLIGEALKTNGFSEDLISMMSDLLEETNLVLSLTGDEDILVENKAQRAKNKKILTNNYKTKNQTSTIETASGKKLVVDSISNLVFKDVHNSAIEFFHDPVSSSKFALGPAVDFDEDGVARINYVDAYLSIATFSVQELSRHARKLEDVGISKYEGNSPTIVISIVAGALAVAAIVVGIFLLIACVGTSDPKACDWASRLFIMGAGFGLIAIDCALTPCSFTVSLFTKVVEIINL